MSIRTPAFLAAFLLAGMSPLAVLAASTPHWVHYTLLNNTGGLPKKVVVLPANIEVYEVTGDKRYWNIADYFWNEVTSERAYCTGGVSNFEFWKTDPGVLSIQLSGDTSEDCCEYNMMKLTRHVFSWSPRAEHMDYYERLMLNHRLRTIDRRYPQLL